MIGINTGLAGTSAADLGPGRQAGAAGLRLLQPIGRALFSIVCGVVLLAAGGAVASIVSPKDLPTPVETF